MKSSRLIYRSIATEEVVSNQTLRDLEKIAADFNSKKDITGLLVVSGRTFLQVLEGDAQDITELFGRILTDKRHHHVELLTFESGVERIFEDWHMRLVDLYDLPGDRREFLASKYAVREGNVLIPDDVHLVYAFLLDARFLCLSTPWSAPGPGATGSADKKKTG